MSGPMGRQGTPWAEILQGDWLPESHEWLGPRFARVLPGLTKRQKGVLYLRYVLELTQAEASEILGVNQQRVSAIERQALARLRTLLQQSTVWFSKASPEKSPQSAPA